MLAIKGLFTSVITGGGCARRAIAGRSPMLGGSRNTTPLVGNTGGAWPSVRVINHPAPGLGSTYWENDVAQDDYFEEKEIVSFTFSNRYYLTGPFRFVAGVFMRWFPNNRQYTLTNQRLKIRIGVLSRRVDEIELYRIKDVEYFASYFERMWSIGNIRIISTQRTDRCPVIKGIRNAEEIRELLRKHVQMSRRQTRAQEIDFARDPNLIGSPDLI